MTYHVEIQSRAELDLRTIYLHINADYAPQARLWFNGLITLIDNLEEFPKRGATWPSGKQLHYLPYGNRPHIYNVLYHVSEQAKIVTVLHIRHSARAKTTRDKFKP